MLCILSTSFTFPHGFICIRRSATMIYLISIKGWFRLKKNSFEFMHLNKMKIINFKLKFIQLIESFVRRIVKQSLQTKILNFFSKQRLVNVCKLIYWIKFDLFFVLFSSNSCKKVLIKNFTVEVWHLVFATFIYSAPSSIPCLSRQMKTFPGVLIYNDFT